MASGPAAPFRPDIFKRAFFRLLRARGETYARVHFTLPRTCPICGYSGRFHPFGLFEIQPTAICANCRSLERHRLLYLCFRDMEIAPGSLDILHFAPEPAVARFARPAARSYTTTDPLEPGMDRAWDITAIDCPDAQFDLILCSHVLEHVDVVPALAELRRILRPGGRALLMVPICEGLDETYENPEVTDEAGRYLHFHQPDHLRVFGRDFRDRLREAGFALREYVADGSRSAAHALTLGDRVFIAERPAP